MKFTSEIPHPNPQTSSQPPNLHTKKPTLLNLESLINLLQSSKTQFTQFIDNHLRLNISSKKHPQDQNTQQNPQFLYHDHQILRNLQQSIPLSDVKFHFNQQETQVVLEETLSFCASIIDQVQTNPNAKKSRTIKRLLTKILLLLNQFLVESLIPSSQMKTSSALNQANFILLQGGSPLEVPNFKGVKGKDSKSHQFQVPLLMTKIRIPFSFYFIFSVIQQKYLKNDTKNPKKTIKELESEVHQISETILLQNENIEARNSFIKTVCESFGSFQFPVTYIFMTSIIEIIQMELKEKYNSLNSETLHSLRLYRETFSLKNVESIFQALIKHESNSFNKFQITLINQDQKKEENQIMSCEVCSVSTESLILVEFSKSLSKKESIFVKDSREKNLIRKILCLNCFTFEEKVNFDKLKESQFKNEKIRFLMRLQNDCLWRQTFDLSSLENYKSMNQNMLLLTGKCSQNDIESKQSLKFEINEQVGLNESQLAFMCLRTLYLNQNSGLDYQGKNKSIISLSALKQKVIEFFLILLNSKSETIRMETIQTLSTQYFMEYLSQNFSDTQILQILQSTLQDYKNKENQIELGQAVRIRAQKLTFHIKYRLFDSCPVIQIKSMTFLLKLRSFFPSSTLKTEIFSFITGIFQEKLLANLLKEIPMEVFRMLFSQIETQCEFDSKNRAADIVSVKHLINKALQMSFSFFDYHAKSGATQFHGDYVWQLVLMVRKLIQRMLWLIDEQERQMKTNMKKIQYENFVICYLKEYCFTKTTINCFIFNDVLLEKLISLTELDEDESENKDIEIDGKHSRLLDNLKLILEELFQFKKQVLKNPAVAKSMEKLSKKNQKQSKKTKTTKHKEFNLTNSHYTFEFKSPSCNLNKIIKNIIRKQKKLNILDCEILYLLLQKNILLNYESEQNFNGTPSKIQRLILSLETTTKFNQILNFLEKQLKQCGMLFIPIYIKLYVVICIQINQEKKIQVLFIFYKNAYKFFKKNWLNEYHKNYDHDIDQPDNTQNDNFFIRSLKTIGFLATEYEKFKKIQFITETGFSEVKRPNVKDYSIFSLQTQEAINALDTFPQPCFVELYQQIYDIFEMFLNNEENIPKRYSIFIRICLEKLASILSIHPHLLTKINSLLRYLPTKMALDPECQACYLSIFESIISAKDSILLNILSRLYDNVGYHILLENENLSKIKYQNLENFYKVTFYLLKEDMISIRQVAKTILYGLFTKNKKINDWTKEYLEYINHKGQDLNLFNDFKRSIQWIAGKLKSIDQYFSQDKEFFRNVLCLTQINKERNTKTRIFLQKDIRAVSIRSTFFKKVAQIFEGDFDWLKYADDEKDACVILILKIIEQQTEMDVYELQELISAMGKIVREYNFIIVKTVDFTGKTPKKQRAKEDDETQYMDFSDEEDYDEDSGSIWDLGQKRRMIFLVGQIMYTLVKLLNEKKLRTVTKDVQKLIEGKKFNSASINLSVNSLPPDQEQKQTLLNYADCLTYIKQLDELFRQPNESHAGIMSLTKQFKEIAKKMYSVIFGDQKARIYVNLQKIQSKKCKKPQSDDEDDQDDRNSDFSQTQYTNSRQSSVESLRSASRNKETKKFGQSVKSASKANNNPTKKVNVSAKTKKNTSGKSRKGLSQSMPKKLQKRLMTIGEISNDEENEIGNRRSKRLMEQEEKKRESTKTIKQI